LNENKEQYYKEHLTRKGKLSSGFNLLGVMHCRERTAASTVEVFHLLWYRQDIKLHKSTNTNFNIEQLHIIFCLILLYRVQGQEEGIMGVGDITKFNRTCFKII